MAWQWIPYMILPLMAVATLIITALYILWHRRHRPASRTGAMVLLACAELMVAYVLEMVGTDLSTKVLWNKMQYVAFAVAPTMWLVYTLQYTGREKWLTRRILALFSIVPPVTLLLVFTNEAHGLMWRRVWLDTDGLFLVVDKTYGVGFWVFVVYSYILMLLSTFLHVQLFIRSRRLYRWQASAMIFATLLPWLGNMLDVFKLSPFSSSVSTALGLILGGLTMAWTIYRLRRGGILSVSRGAIIRSMSDGVVVLDEENRIVDLNPVAQHLIGRPLSQAVGQPVEQVWPEWHGQIELPHDVVEVSKEAVLSEGDRQRTYDVRISPLVDWRGRLVSRAIVLRDITERKRRTAELSTMLEATRAVSSTLDLEEVLVLIAKEMAKATGVDGCTLSRWDQEADTVVSWIEWRRQWPEWADDPGTAYALDDYPATRAVLETRQPHSVCVSDPDAHPAEVAHLRKVESASLLMLPLAVGDRVVGLVELDTDEYERDFTAAEVRLCQALADQAAIAIQNAGLFEETRRRGEEVRLLFEATRDVSASLELDEVLERIAAHLCWAAEATSGDIMILDESGERATVCAQYWTPGASLLERTLDVGTVYDLTWHPAILQAMRENRPLVTHADDPNLEPATREMMARFGGRSALRIPIHVTGVLHGYALIWDSQRRHEWTDEEVQLCQTLANQVAIAIENARLHAQTERRLQEQIALREAGAVMTSALDLDTVLTRIAEQMSQAVDVTSAYISRHEPEAKTSTVVAEYIGPQACARERVSDLGITYPYAEGDTGFVEVMEAGRHDISQLDDPDLPESERAHMREYGGQTVLYIPLRIAGRFIGYAELWESRRQREFTPEEIALCEGIAQQAAIALENARLYEQAQEEIAERSRAEEQIRASLREKEVLLKEIHHRVRNNLQVISSLLFLQSKNVRDQRSLEILQDSQNRVRSMALVHERLYQSQDLARVDFAKYVRSLVNHLFRSYGVNSNVIRLKVNVGDISLGVDTAIPCGLIINELVSNSLKHAFPDGREGEIHIELRSDDGGCTLMIGDNGVGFPKGLEFRRVGTLGLQLVNTLVNQLEGTMELDRSSGTAFTIGFTQTG